jgi:hypothetical protein
MGIALTALTSSRKGLSGGVQDLGEPVVEELLRDWLDPFLTEAEQDRLLACYLGVSR